MELVRRIQGASIRSLTFTTQNINPGNPNFRLIRTIQDAPTPRPRRRRQPDDLDPTLPGPWCRRPKSTKTSTGPTKSTTTSSSITTDELVDLREAC
jgi:hypothetical protein